MTRVLVTGASGFVGSALCSALVQARYCVIGVVRQVREGVPAVTYIETDLTTPHAFAHTFPVVDCVIHLAGRAHVLNDSSEDPLAAFRAANRDATLRLARRALNAGVKRFVFVSSIGVNGSHTRYEPFREDNSVHPHAFYAISKWEAEIELKALLEGTAMELVIVRPPLIYAANAPGNFGRLLKLIGSGLPLPLKNAENLRSLISKQNFVEFLQLCIHHPNAAGELFFVADGQDISTPDMVRSICLGMDKPARLFPFPLTWLKLALLCLGKASIYEQLCGSLQVDASKARRLLGWVPSNTTLAGLQQAGRNYLSSPKELE